MKPRKAVQMMINTKGSFSHMGLLIEQLRYAGLVALLSEREDANDIEMTWFILKLYCPKGLDDKVWAKQNVDRIKSFGLNATEVNE